MRIFISFVISCLIFFIMVHSPAFSQQINYWENFKINSSDAQWSGAYPVTASLSNGNVVFCWIKDYEHFVGMLYDSQLKPIGNEFILNSYGGMGKNIVHSDDTIPNEPNGKTDQAISDAGFVMDHELAVHGTLNGGFVFAYCHPDGTVRMKIFDANGKSIGNMATLGPPEKYRAHHPSLTTLENGNIVLCCHAGPTAGAIRSGDSGGVYCQVFNSSGSKISDKIKVSSTESKNEWNPVVAALEGNLFIVCWQDGLWDIGQANILGQVFNQSGDKINAEILVNADMQSYNFEPQVITLKNNDFLVLWDSKGTIKARFFSSSASPKGGIIFINKNNSESNPVLAQTDNGEILLCRFEDRRFVGQLFDQSLTPQYPEFFINTSNFFSEYIKVDAFSGGFIACWQAEDKISINGKYYFNKPILQRLDDFYLHAPINSDSLKQVSVNFVWGAASNKKRCYPFEILYDLQIIQDNDFSNPITYFDIADTTINIYLKEEHEYSWRIIAKNIAEEKLESVNTGNFIIPKLPPPVGIESKEADKSQLYYNLISVYPNPFNSQVTLKYYLPEKSSAFSVSINIFDILGRNIKSLIDDEQSSGNYKVIWDGTNSAGFSVSSGIYYFQIEIDNSIIQQKAILMH